MLSLKTKPLDYNKGENLGKLGCMFRIKRLLVFAGIIRQLVGFYWILSVFCSCVFWIIKSRKARRNAGFCLEGANGSKAAQNAGALPEKRKTCGARIAHRRCWWRRVDSNHRSETQQIYSLPPLATREPIQNCSDS